MYPKKSWISLFCYNRNIITIGPEIEEKKGQKKILGRKKTSRSRRDSTPSHTSKPSSTQDSQKFSGSPQNVSSKDLDVPIAIRKGGRSCTSRPLYPMSKYVSYKNLSTSFSSFTSQLSCIEIPKTVQDALKIPGWKEAILEEMKALEKNQT